jgi:protoheme IX farnesyltransferase
MRSVDVVEARSEGDGISIADLVQLAKPRITLMCVITTAGGIWLAERIPSIHPLDATTASLMGAERPVATSITILMALVGTALIVSGANALNMYIERDIDRHMTRTKGRPLPSRRMSPRVALWFGVALSVIAVPILALGVNPLTALLAVLANVSYVLAYTPMKQRSHHALLVGAVPGAIPPLLGWTAVTGRIDAGGAVLFAILFLWQIPHFLAITLFRRDEYARAGLQVMPNVTGDEPVRHAIVRWTMALVATTFLLLPLGIAHRGYFVVAALLGALFFGVGCAGLRTLTPVKLRTWSRSLFAVSIVYLVALFAAIMVDPFA